jgi:hypothetical protein
VARPRLAVAPIYDGAACSEAAKIGGVALQIVRDWIVEFDSHGPERADRKPPGNQATSERPSGHGLSSPSPLPLDSRCRSLTSILNLRRHPVRRRHLIRVIIKAMINSWPFIG